VLLQTGKMTSGDLNVLNRVEHAVEVEAKN
jgi:hypothetical protein